MLPLRYYVISKARAANVGPMHALIGHDAVTWIVPPEDEAAYRENGAVLVATAEGLCAARNTALSDAFVQDCWCVQMSDDIQSISISPDERRAPCLDEANRRSGDEGLPVPVTPEAAATAVGEEMMKRGTFLGGAYVNNNVGFALNAEAWSSHKFIVGDFMVIRPCSLRFDEKMSLKEDYDYTAQHVDEFGAVTRMNRLFVRAKHYTNKGGAVDVRTAALEQCTINHLTTKWSLRGYPKLFRLNPTRMNEVIMFYCKEYKLRLAEKHGRSAD